MNANRYRQLSRVGVALALVGAILGYTLISFWLSSVDCTGVRSGSLCTFFANGAGPQLRIFFAILGASVATTPGILLFLSAAIRADQAANGGDKDELR